MSLVFAALDIATGKVIGSCHRCHRHHLRLPRVTYKAQEAILKIKEQPVPTWY